MSEEQKSQQQGMKRFFIRLKSPTKDRIFARSGSALLILAKTAATALRSSSSKRPSTISWNEFFFIYVKREEECLAVGRTFIAFPHLLYSSEWSHLLRCRRISMENHGRRCDRRMFAPKSKDFFFPYWKKACPVGMTTPGLVHYIIAYLSFTSKAVVLRQTHAFTALKKIYKQYTIVV